ncbi:MAG: hypothetical protein JWO12_2033 [Frankiales bacterium]|nr:hypothetical protein [Frankiales bacterium]
MVVTVIAMCVGSVLLAAVVALGVARWFAARAVEDDPFIAEDVLLPEGHRPPPGLSPLSPSERFLSAEATRGLRDLEKYLIEAA